MINLAAVSDPHDLGVNTRIRIEFDPRIDNAAETKVSIELPDSADSHQGMRVVSTERAVHIHLWGSWEREALFDAWMSIARQMKHALEAKEQHQRFYEERRV